MAHDLSLAQSHACHLCNDLVAPIILFMSRNGITHGRGILLRRQGMIDWHGKNKLVVEHRAVLDAGRLGRIWLDQDVDFVSRQRNTAECK